jgi:ubiquinone/menaquinone biosynthesis C-methylase UbiE
MKMETYKKYDKFSRFYDTFETHVEKRKFGKWRNEVFEMIPAGSFILEVGIGTGKNLPYYGKGINVIGIDFSKGMLEKARERVKAHPEKKVSLLQMDVAMLDFPENYFDFVVSTFVFCTVPDPMAGFKEVKRVLKPDGKAIFLEHMRSASWFNNLFLYAMSGMSIPIIGTSMVRKTKLSIQESGFHIGEEKNLFSDIVKLLVCSK